MKFCLDNGGNLNIVELVRENNFLSGCTCIYGSNYLTSDLYCLKRFCVSEMPISAFVVKIAKLLAFD